MKETNAGGQGSQVLARLGYAAIVLEGKSKNDKLYTEISLPSNRNMKPFGLMAAIAASMT
ncbi:MAG: hypothetical protein WBM78_24055 [Desulfobacterales bacterium]